MAIDTTSIRDHFIGIIKNNNTVLDVANGYRDIGCYFVLRHSCGVTISISVADNGSASVSNKQLKSNKGTAIDSISDIISKLCKCSLYKYIIYGTEVVDDPYYYNFVNCYKNVSPGFIKNQYAIKSVEYNAQFSRDGTFLRENKEGRYSVFNICWCSKHSNGHVAFDTLSDLYYPMVRMSNKLFIFDSFMHTKKKYIIGENIKEACHLLYVNMSNSL